MNFLKFGKYDKILLGTFAWFTLVKRLLELIFIKLTYFYFFKLD